MDEIKALEGKSVVVALGGNALGKTPEEQRTLVKNTAKNIVDMVASGLKVVVTHGNGPQVGVIYNAFSLASSDNSSVPFMPFPECGAMSQGYIGYHLSQAIQNELDRRGIDKKSCAMITQTLVDKSDPAFDDPSKPVGVFLSKEEADKKAKETGLRFKEDAGRGYRQVVASPKPIKILNQEIIKSLALAGNIVVVSGGGGIPVIKTKDGYEGVPAVIDKDRSCAQLAIEFNADLMVILTAVEKVAINYNTPSQKDLSEISVGEAWEYIDEGQFAPGSMLPKIESCLDYLKSVPQGKALITSLDSVLDALAGRTGTIIKSN